MNKIAPQGTREETDQAVYKRLVQVAVMLALFVACIFLSAGRIDWLWGWIYLGLYLAMMAGNALTMDRELVAERAQVGAGTKKWDLVLGSLTILLGQPVTLLVCGLDERFGWTSFSLPVQIAGGVIFALGCALVVWAMASNKFFATTVRIQEERGHTVTTGGAYRLVRHPSYLAFALMALGTPALLDSAWGYVPAVLSIAAVVARTALEDKTLQEELEGYAEYTQKTRYRLIPGIW